MTETTPSRRAGLRDEIAKAIHRYDNEHALSGNDIPSRHHRGEADAVMALLYREWPWLRAEAEETATAQAEVERLRANIAGCRNQQWPQRLGQAEKALNRVRRLVAEYPAGIDTALIDEALDQTQAPAPPPVHCPCGGVHFPSPDNCRWCKCHRNRATPAPAATAATDRATRLDTLTRDILSSFVPTRDSTGMNITHHQAVVRPHEMRAWQDALDDTQEE